MKRSSIFVGAVVVAWALAMGWDARADEKAKKTKGTATPPAAAQPAATQPAANPPADDEGPVAVSPLRGAWQAVKMVAGDEASSAADLRRTRVIFGNKTFLIRSGSKTIVKMDYKYDATATPTTIDITSEDGTSLGIYTFAKGRLLIAWNESGKPRPAKIDEKCDGSLELSPMGNLIEAIDVKTGKARVVIDDLLFTNTGSPQWSPDGRRMACDGWKAGRGQGMSSAHVLVCDADGKNLKSLGRGVMPTWSPDGKQIGFSSSGVWKMNADGTNREQIDNNGYAMEWCPKGNKVAYIVGGNVCVRDLDKNESEMLLDRPYDSIHYGMSWSPDGQWICFKGISNRAQDLAIVHAGGEKKGFRVLISSNANTPNQTEIGHNFTWSPDGKQVLAPLMPPGGKHLQLHLVDIDGKSKPKLLDWQRADRWYKSPTWSPTGREIAYLRTRTTPE